MENIEVKQVSETLLNLAKKELNEGREVTPVMAFLKLGEKPKLVPIPNFMMDGRMKDFLSVTMREGAKAMQADFFFFLTDTWMASSPKDKQDEFAARRMACGGNVKDMPEREEGLLLTIESKVTQTMITVKHKKKDGRTVFEPKTEVSGEGTGMTGRFTGVLYSPSVRN